MADNVNVTQGKTEFDADTNPVIPARTTQLTAGANIDQHVAHVKLDLGTAASEDVVDGGAVPVAHNITGISDGRKTIASAGTAETLVSSSTPAKYTVITAETDNTGVVVVGGSTVVASLSTRQGVPLNPGDSVALPCEDLQEIYLDVTVSGDGVTFAAFT